MRLVAHRFYWLEASPKGSLVERFPALSKIIIKKKKKDCCACAFICTQNCKLRHFSASEIRLSCSRLVERELQFPFMALLISGQNLYSFLILGLY